MENGTFFPRCTNYFKNKYCRCFPLAAERIASQQVDKLKSLNVSNAALVAMDANTGDILAMLGSVDFNNKEISGQVNVATSKRQPGSSIKPVTYLAAFEKGWTPSTLILDNQTTWTTKPGNGKPPQMITTYISVIVTTSIERTKDGLVGNIVGHAILRVDGPYKDDPGKAVSGVVVALLP